MLSRQRTIRAAMIAALVASLAAGSALAQSKSGKIVCWKDKDGKVVGCGDRIPPEYQGAATKELDKRGVTRKTTESAEERAKLEAEKKADAKEAAQQRAEEKRRIEEQRRQDTALINTFSNEKEIDLKRDRDLAVVDGQLTQLRVAHKNASDRQKEVKTRYDAQAKGKKSVSGPMKEEMERADASVATAAERVTAKEKEKEEIRKRYAEMKSRYILLRGGTSSAKK